MSEIPELYQFLKGFIDKTFFVHVSGHVTIYNNNDALSWLTNYMENVLLILEKTYTWWYKGVN